MLELGIKVQNICNSYESAKSKKANSKVESFANNMSDAKSLSSLEKEITETFTGYPFLERLGKTREKPRHCTDTSSATHTASKA